MKKNVSRLYLNAFFFIYYDQVLNNLYLSLILTKLEHNEKSSFIVFYVDSKMLFSWLVNLVTGSKSIML
jgi:hypothetical protein